MNNLVIIPARGGSKRIPYKNIKDFNGKPILAYVIQAVKVTDLFEEIIVSTDDTLVAEVAKEFGANVPFLRSNKNSDDHATLADVLIEVIQKYKELGKTFDNICCILPTAALVTTEKIQEGFDLLKKNKVYSVVPVIKFASPIQRALKVEKDLLVLRETKHIITRSQDLEDHYHDSGQFYWLNTEEFLKEKKIFTSKTGYIELKENEAQDVDTPEDWKMLELKFNFKK